MSFILECLLGVLLASARDQHTPPKEGKTRQEQNRVPVKQETLEKASLSRDAARVAGEWQDLMLKKFKAENYAEAWGIFSYGGWSDAGQLMVFYGKDSSPVAKLVLVKPNAKTVQLERPLNLKELHLIRPKLEAIKDLKDVEKTMFDGVVYEFVAVTKAESSAPQLKVYRVLYKNPGIHEKFPKMDALTDLLQAFVDDSSKATSADTSESHSTPPK